MSRVSTAAVPRTRERILDVALDLFAEEGFSGTTVTEIERRAGLSPGSGSFYRHFPSKEAVLTAAVEREVERLHAESAARHAGPADNDTAEGRLAGTRRILEDIRRFDRLIKLALADGDRLPGLRTTITNALRRGRPGVGWDDDPAVALAIAAVGGYHLFSLVQGRPFEDIPEDEFLAAAADLLRPPS